MPDGLILTRTQYQAMRRHVTRRLPLEACGLLAGRISPGGKSARVERTIGVPNAERSPVRFRMPPRLQLRAFRQIEAAGLKLVGIYHSHPDGPEVPSPTDLAEAAYPAASLIWSRREGKWQVRGFRIEGGRFNEISLQIINGW
jgi:proteasome lid subunit RPN8/RPN11